jgi:hypothetical protein
VDDGRTVAEVLEDLAYRLESERSYVEAECVRKAIVAVQNYEARAARESKAETSRERSEAR